ncbi:MAG: fumarylacetoacetate hydrolase family protein [Bacillus sp. (in: firmicutes)]
MKLVTALYEGKSAVGVIGTDEKTVLLLNDAEEKRSGQRPFLDNMIVCIEEGEDFLAKVESLVQWVNEEQLVNELYLPLERITLQAPIPRPSKNIFCVGKNYAEHAIEMGSKDDIPEHVMIFTKAPTTVVGPNEGILEHKQVTDQLDYEGELAVVIGKTGRAIKREDALDYVFGYTIVNDITARDLQKKHKQFFIGKSLDASAPMGPWIVTKSEIKNPHSLHIQTVVNGERRQDSNTENFIFPIDEVICVLSKGMTLEPGDIIATGTPAGVGKGFNPPRFLKAGDKIDISVEGIGVLSNTIVE